MEGFTLYFGLLSIISFFCILLFLLLLIKLFALHVHGLIVIVCGLLLSCVFFGVDFPPFRTVSNALILLTLLVVCYLIVLFLKRR